jgi:menaquinone-dependent protoporphyrinogen oxidase
MERLARMKSAVAPLILVIPTSCRNPGSLPEAPARKVENAAANPGLNDNRAGMSHANRETEGAMKVAVFFATREGQTSKIAHRVAEDLRAKGVSVDVVNVKEQPAISDWPTYATAFVAASVHTGHHEREMIDFARRYRDDLTRIGAVFISVSMSEAGAEDVRASAERRERSAADAQRMVDVFIKETGWKPECYLRVAGALLYTQYNFLVRFVMKRISRQNGGPTDTSRDYEFTDWPSLDRFVDEVIAPLPGGRPG